MNSGFPVFRDCVGMIDGSLLAFRWRPFPTEERAMQYWNHRKSKYGLQATLVCNDKGRILYFSSSYPGYSHDAKCLSLTDIAQEPERLVIISKQRQ